MEEKAHLDVDLLLDAGVSDGVGSQHQVVIMQPDNGNLTAGNNDYILNKFYFYLEEC